MDVVSLLVINWLCVADLFLKVANPSLLEHITAASATGMYVHTYMRVRTHTHKFVTSSITTAVNLVNILRIDKSATFNMDLCIAFESWSASLQTNLHRYTHTVSQLATLSVLV